MLQVDVIKIRHHDRPRSNDLNAGGYTNSRHLLAAGASGGANFLYLLTCLHLKHRLPKMVHTGEMVKSGGLISYGADYLDLFRHAPEYVDRILKGTKPADLPVQQSTKFVLVVNRPQNPTSASCPR